MNLLARKKALRDLMRSFLKEISPHDRETASAKIRTQLKAHPLWARSRNILFFAPLPQEIDLWPLLPEALAAGKSAFLPRYHPESESYVAAEIGNPESECVPGRFGIREPSPAYPEAPLKHLDLILVPALGFDKLGGRLGRGRGFYDRLLAQAPGVKCGVGYDRQLLEEVPVDAHDIRMNYILTPSGWIDSLPI